MLNGHGWRAPEPFDVHEKRVQLALVRIHVLDGLLRIRQRPQAELPVLVRGTQINYSVLDFHQPLRFDRQGAAEVGCFTLQPDVSGQFCFLGPDSVISLSPG